MKAIKSFVKHLRHAEPHRRNEHHNRQAAAGNPAPADDALLPAAVSASGSAAGPGHTRTGASGQARQTANQPDIEQAQELLLQHLRIGNERDHDLVSIPVCDNLGGRTPQPPADPQTESLSGLAYIEYLAEDARLLPTLKGLIREKILPVARNMQQRPLDDMVKKLRLVVAEAYRDPELAMRMEYVALEFIGYCGDRAEYILSQLHGEALLANLRRGDIDDVSLYNIGVSFFKLNALHQEIHQHHPEILRTSQSVHEIQDLEFRLQDRLKLPFRHDPPVYGHTVRHSCAALADTLASAVEARCIKNDGEDVIAFMSTWEPWIAAVMQSDRNREDIEKLSGLYQAVFSRYETNRDTPGTPESKYTDQQAVEFMNTIMQRRETWITEYVGQKAREFLVNHRACIALNHHIQSRYLNH